MLPSVVSEKLIVTIAVPLEFVAVFSFRKKEVEIATVWKMH